MGLQKAYFSPVVKKKNIFKIIFLRVPMGKEIKGKANYYDYSNL